MKTLIGALALALAVQGAATAQTTAARPQASGTIQGGGAVTLVPAGKNGPAGSAVLAQQGGNLLVTLHLPPGYQPTGKAAIYSGSCKASGAAAASSGQSYVLTVDPKGSPSSTTLQNLSLETLTSSPHVIVVRGTPALCGDVTNLLPPQKP